MHKCHLCGTVYNTYIKVWLIYQNLYSTSITLPVLCPPCISYFCLDSSIAISSNACCTSSERKSRSEGTYGQKEKIYQTVIKVATPYYYFLIANTVIYISFCGTYIKFCVIYNCFCGHLKKDVWSFMKFLW
jgi:hypothetical protein